MLALIIPLLKSKIQRLQNKYYTELEGLGVCFDKLLLSNILGKSSMLVIPLLGGIVSRSLQKKSSRYLLLNYGPIKSKHRPYGTIL